VWFLRCVDRMYNISMNNPSNNRGFIKAAIFLVIAIAVVFLVLVVFSKYLVPGALVGGLGNGSTSGGFFANSSSYEVKTNPLLDFSSYGGSSGYSYNNGDRSQPNTDGSGGSPYGNKVSLSYGTAGSAYQTFEEYVTLNNSGPAVNITGWTLTNSKGSRPIENRQTNYVYPVADSATIGTGTEFLSPDGAFKTGSIILKTGDVAYLTTGRPYSQYPFSISTSFRENICVGYLKNYPFSPALNNSCPYITNDPLIKTVTDECYDYMRTLSRCVDPEKEDKKRFDENITSQCRAFIRPRLNYAGCVDNSSNLSNFSTNIWRIFLSKDKELWSNSRETITLYDASGLIVDQISY